MNVILKGRWSGLSSVCPLVVKKLNPLMHQSMFSTAFLHPNRQFLLCGLKPYESTHRVITSAFYIIHTPTHPQTHTCTYICTHTHRVQKTSQQNSDRLQRVERDEQRHSEKGTSKILSGAHTPRHLLQGYYLSVSQSQCVRECVCVSFPCSDSENPIIRHTNCNCTVYAATKRQNIAHIKIPAGRWKSQYL